MFTMIEERVFPDPAGGAWKRTGHCCQCGQCCVGHPGGELTGPLPGMCPHLRQDGERFACIDHGKPNTYWSNGCHEFPWHPLNVAHIAACTYRFERI